MLMFLDGSDSKLNPFWPKRTQSKDAGFIEKILRLTKQEMIVLKN